MSPPHAGGRLTKLQVVRTAVGVVWAASPLLFAAIAIISICSGFIAPATAWLQRDILDLLASSGGHLGSKESGLLYAVAGLGAVGVLAAVTPQGQQYLQASLRRAVSLIVTDRAYRAVASWPGIARFESPWYADQLQLTSQFGQSTASSLIDSVLSFAQCLIMAVSFLIALMVISPILAAVTVSTQSLSIVASFANARSQAQLRLENSARSRRQNSFGVLLSDAVAAKEVRLYGLGGFLRGRLMSELRSANTAERALGRRLLVIETGLAFMSSAVIAGGLIWTVAQVADRHLPLGDVSLFVLAALGLQGALNQIASSVGNLAQSVTLFSAYANIISAPPDLPVARDPERVPPLRQGITVDDVWFRYDESHPWVLRGLSMAIPAGSRTGLVGVNGSGKSTLVKLLCRLYDPERGSIRWDGIDIRDLDPAELRTRIAAVFQDFMCYELTAAENIGVGDLDAMADRATVTRAAALAGVDDDIARLPMGYDTLLSRVFRPVLLSDGFRVGVTLSGGQRQRLALARALMRAGRDLLIVDEPVSNLDPEAEHAVNQRLASGQAGRTCVLISHRMASMRGCDEIVVLSGGVVSEAGTHAELLARDGHYARLFKLQAQGYGQAEGHDIGNTVNSEAAR